MKSAATRRQFCKRLERRPPRRYAMDQRRRAYPRASTNFSFRGVVIPSRRGRINPSRPRDGGRRSSRAVWMCRSPSAAPGPFSRLRSALHTPSRCSSKERSDITSEKEMRMRRTRVAHPRREGDTDPAAPGNNTIAPPSSRRRGNSTIVCCRHGEARLWRRMVIPSRGSHSRHVDPVRSPNGCSFSLHSTSGKCWGASTSPIVLRPGRDPVPSRCCSQSAIANHHPVEVPPPSRSNRPHSPVVTVWRYASDT